MNVFLVCVRGRDYWRLLPTELGGSPPGGERIKVMAFPPLGIQTLAPVLRRSGHHVRMFDTCHPQMKGQHVARAARQERPDVIALSFLSVTSYPEVKDMARRLKTEVPETPIVVGGAFATINADLILRDCPDIDCAGIGEGEELLPDYLNHLDNPCSVAGLVWRSDGQVVRNAPRPLIEDLDQFPYPDRTSLPIDYVESLPLDVPAVLSLDKFCTMQTSRGCPYSCVYCDIPAVSHGRWRYRSAEHVLGEMQQLSDAGYRSICLTDDHFLLRRQRIKAICTGIIQRKLRFHWSCEGRVDSLAVDQFSLMSRAKCTAMAFGLEAGTQRMLDRLGKNQTLAQIEHAVSEAKRQGIDRLHGFFIIGSPGETKADIAETFRLAARLPVDTVGFSRLCVYRGTPLWREYVDRGIIDDERDWHHHFRCSDIDPTILASSAIIRLRAKGYAMFFAKRILRHPIRSYKLLRTFSRHMTRSDLMRLFSSPFRRPTAAHEPKPPAGATYPRPARPWAAARPNGGINQHAACGEPMRLYLINPNNSLVSLANVKSNRWNHYRVWKPLGLLVLAGLTPPEWDITVIDENLHLPDYAAMPRPDLVGITAFTSQASRAYELAGEFRARGVSVVMGGIHATMCSREALHHVDSVVTGEAESVWPDVLADARQGRLKRTYSGEHVDLAKVPPARHDLLDEGYAFGAIQTTRGCPLNCSFCSVSAFNGTRYRHRPIDSVIEEIRSIREKWVLVVDDNLIGTTSSHIARAKELFRAMIRADLGKKWIGQATINLADDEELLDLAGRAGCRGMFIGFESPTPEGLAEVGKKFNLLKGRDFKASVRRIRRHKILVVGSFIMGLDADGPGIGRQIARTAGTYGVDILNALFLTPLPGTRLWDKMASENRITAHDFPRDWKYYTLTFPTARYKHLSWTQILAEMNACDGSFYSWRRILWRLAGSLLRRRRPFLLLVSNLSYRNNARLSRGDYAQLRLPHERAGHQRTAAPEGSPVGWPVDLERSGAV